MDHDDYCMVDVLIYTKDWLRSLETGSGMFSRLTDEERESVLVLVDGWVRTR